MRFGNSREDAAGHPPPQRPLRLACAVTHSRSVTAGQLVEESATIKKIGVRVGVRVTPDPMPFLGQRQAVPFLSSKPRLWKTLIIHTLPDVQHREGFPSPGTDPGHVLAPRATPHHRMQGQWALGANPTTSPSWQHGLWTGQSGSGCVGSGRSQISLCQSEWPHTLLCFGVLGD